jgi:hypothetical protein
MSARVTRTRDDVLDFARPLEDGAGVRFEGILQEIGKGMVTEESSSCKLSGGGLRACDQFCRYDAVWEVGQCKERVRVRISLVERIPLRSWDVFQRMRR